MYRKNFFLLICLLSFLPYIANAEGTSALDAISKNSAFSMSMNDQPTYIKSSRLTLKTEEQTFTYSGNVDIIHGDLHMTCSELEGKYGDNNQIESMVAKKNVVITKGKDIRASCQTAIFGQKTSTITLTENPELQQDGSILCADAITLNIETNKSEAQGNVRVKLVKADKNK